MLAEDVPAALRDRLGDDGAAALVELLDQTIDERKPEMITAATERFERRLVEEISGVRVLLAQSEARLREQVAQSEARLREQLAQTEAGLREQLAQTEVRLAQNDAGLREQLAQSEAGLRDQLGQREVRLREDVATNLATIRQEMATSEKRIRQDIADGRVELFKWSFLFWIGQTLALAGFMSVIVRMARP